MSEPRFITSFCTFCLFPLNIVILVFAGGSWFTIDIDGYTFDSEFQDPTWIDESIKVFCRNDCFSYGHNVNDNRHVTMLKDIHGPEDCIPEELLHIFDGQEWYAPDGGLCDVSFEKHAGKAAMMLGITSLVALFLSGCCVCCINDRNSNESNHIETQLEVWQICHACARTPLFFLSAICMTGMLICVVPFGMGNMCGKEGNNMIHVVLCCLIACFVMGCFCLNGCCKSSVSHVAQSVRVRRRKSVLMASKSNAKNVNMQTTSL